MGIIWFSLPRLNTAFATRRFWNALNHIAMSNQRETAAIVHSGILSATYYSIPIARAHKSKAERLEQRKNRHTKALKALRGVDVVYVDPDNGLMVPSGQGTTKMSNYFETREDLA